jgi:hypothetical protein
MQDIRVWCAWHRKNCRITKASVLVYVTPVVINFFAPGRSEHPGFADIFWMVVASLLEATSVGFGIWLSKSIMRRGLAVLFVCTWIADYVAVLVGKDLGNWVLGCGLVCLWLAWFACG